MDHSNLFSGQWCDNGVQYLPRWTKLTVDTICQLKTPEYWFWFSKQNLRILSFLTQFWNDDFTNCLTVICHRKLCHKKLSTLEFICLQFWTIWTIADLMRKTLVKLCQIVVKNFWNPQFLETPSQKPVGSFSTLFTAVSCFPFNFTNPNQFLYLVTNYMINL